MSNKERDTMSRFIKRLFGFLSKLDLNSYQYKVFNFMRDRQTINGKTSKDPAIWFRRLDDMGFPKRFLEALRRNNYAGRFQFVGDLLKVSADTLFHTPNIGRKLIRVSEGILSEYGLTLDSPIADWEEKKAAYLAGEPHQSLSDRMNWEGEIRC